MHTFIPTSHYAERFAELAPYIGNTPLYPIQKLSPNPRVKIFAKLEWQQMGGSVKARPAYRIMQDAIERGQLSQKRRLLDASSGNTGIAYAVFAAVAGIPFTLFLPGNASKERKHILKTLGVDIRYTSPFESTDGAQREALKLVQAEPERYFYADQYNNDNNWKAHYDTTAEEIIQQTGGQITHFISGLGTTGTFTGTSRKLKEKVKDVKVIGLQPETALHGLEGWKHLETANVPGIYDSALADQIHTVDTLASYEVLKEAARYEGLFLSPSAAANLLGAICLAEQIDEGTIVTVFADDASKYTEVVDQLLSESV